MKPFGSSICASIALVACLSLITGCSASAPSPTANLLPNNPAPPAPPIPIPQPSDLVDNSPEVITTKQVLQEVRAIKEAAASDPALVITMEDIDLLNEESLLDSPDQLNEWVQ